MLTIKFTENHNNKLDCKIFTTIRVHDENKERHYKSSIGFDFNVHVGEDDANDFQATLIDCSVEWYNTIPMFSLMVDTGESSEERADNKFKKFGIKTGDKVLVLTFLSLKSANQESTVPHNQINMF